MKKQFAKKSYFSLNLFTVGGVMLLNSVSCLAYAASTTASSAIEQRYSNQTTSLTYAQTLDYLTPEVINKAQALINKHFYNWNYTFVMLSTLNITPNGTVQGYDASTFVEKVMINGFYKGINGRNPIELTNNTLNITAYKEYQDLYLICSKALPYVDLTAKILATTAVRPDFCKNIVFYYQLFIEPFNLAQQKSLQASAVKQYIPEYRWRLLTLGRFGFQYSLPTKEILLQTPLARYISE
ncbi:hypothetical protein [Psittacicella hinzii]|uniref:Uncharacterized protein n=1 Tax=Psittacicella hinzii TaxID=2028575 RepID=A0A3A1YDH5_9GAMM|nr:hypothetical protein [Psittacicella hinzii]RIY35220.1 hypothetical protein CKF58_06880 [Psittacicella hinzii]